MSQHCNPGLQEINKALQEVPTGTDLALSERLGYLDGTDASEIFETIASVLTMENERIFREEFGSLPESLILTFFALWREADRAGKRFEIQSSSPASPIKDARAGRVSWYVNMDEEGSRMVITHVYGHHADWFRRAELAAT